MSFNLSPLTLSVALLTLIIPSGDSTVLKVVSLLERNELVLTTPCKFNPDPLSRKVSDELEGFLLVAEPPDLCSKPSVPASISGNGTESIENYVLLGTWDRNDRCDLRTKIKNADDIGYAAVVIQLPLNEYFPPSYYEWDTSLAIFPCLVNNEDGTLLRRNFTGDDYVVEFEDEPIDSWTRFFITTFLALIAILLAIALSYCVVQMFILMVVWIRNSVIHALEQRRINRRRRLPSRQLKKIPIQQWTADIPQDMCTICLENYVENEKVRILPCSHVFHMACIDPWLLKQRRKCPNCKRKIVFPDEPYHSDSSTEDERTPLIRREGSLDHSIAGGLTFTFNERAFEDQPHPITRAIHRMILENERQRQRSLVQQRRLSGESQGHDNPVPGTSSESSPASSSCESSSAMQNAILRNAIRHNRLSRFCPRRRLPRSLFPQTHRSHTEYLEDTTPGPSSRAQVPHGEETRSVDHDGGHGPEIWDPRSHNPEGHNEFLEEATRAYEESLRQVQTQDEVDRNRSEISSRNGGNDSDNGHYHQEDQSQRTSLT